MEYLKLIAKKAKNRLLQKVTDIQYVLYISFKLSYLVEEDETDNNNSLEVAVLNFNVKDNCISVVAKRDIVQAIKGKSKAKVNIFELHVPFQ